MYIRSFSQRRKFVGAMSLATALTASSYALVAEASDTEYLLVIPSAASNSYKLNIHMEVAPETGVIEKLRLHVNGDVVDGGICVPGKCVGEVGKKVIQELTVKISEGSTCLTVIWGGTARSYCKP